MKLTLNEIADYLIRKAIMLQQKDLKPGRLIKNLPEEIRKHVKNLTSKHFYHPRVMKGEKE